MRRYIHPVLWILMFQAIAGAIGFITSSNMGWYDTLAKSALTPPDIAFPIVWTTLYVMLAVAGWMVWRDRAQKPLVFRLYWLQMGLNWGWSFVFFGAQMVLAGFLWIVVFDLAMLVFIVAAWRAGLKWPALLVLPTLLWGSFAGYLNYAIWVLN